MTNNRDDLKAKSGPVLVTGAAGFIGHALSRKLIERGEHVIGIDNLNDYYDPRLKAARLETCTLYLSSGSRKWMYPTMKASLSWCRMRV